MPDQVDSRGVVLSTDAKPRLKWTHQLHECFVDAVSQLGGADKATPKSVMQVMGVPGVTLYHLKSYLQKYRLSKNRDYTTNNRREDIMAADYRLLENVTPQNNDYKTQFQFHNSRSMFQLQMDDRRRLQEQIEVQKHLQLRIEAQGKYLQSVLWKAQETIAYYSMNSLEAETANAEFSELVSAVDSECLSSTFFQCSSVLRQILYGDCSTHSCLTSSERPVLKGNKHNIDHSSDWSAESDELNPCNSKEVELESSNGFRGEKRVKYLHQVEECMVAPEEIDLNR